MAAASRNTEILVGGAALALGAVFLVWAFTGGGLFANAGYPVTARFEQVDGLAVGAEARLAGVAVGKVRTLEYDPDTEQAIVTLSIEEGVELPEDTSASVVQNGVLGDKFVQLSPGGMAEAIPPGGEIRYTQSSVLVIDIIERIVKDAERRRGATGG